MSIVFLIAAATMAAPATAEASAIFTAAGASRRGKAWTMCAEDPRATARIDVYRDLNGDSRADAVVVEDSLRCYGGDETSFVLVSRQPDGRWRKMLGTVGVAQILNARGVARWPDISVGGQGFCFPVLRWNGREYANHRREYQGKPCR